MDILIELIIWLFRNLFGMQEPPAKLGPRPDRDATGWGGRGKREGEEDGAPRPKTLAELLAEARRQMGEETGEAAGRGAAAARRQMGEETGEAAGRGAAAASSLPRAVPPPQPAPPPRPAMAALPRLERARDEMVEMPVLRPVAPLALAPEATRLAEAQPPLSVLPSLSERLTIPRKAAGEGLIPLAPGEAARLLAAKAAVARPAGEALRDYLAELRGASERGRAGLVMQGLAAIEIFERPRWRRPYRPFSHLARRA